MAVNIAETLLDHLQIEDKRSKYYVEIIRISKGDWDDNKMGSILEKIFSNTPYSDLYVIKGIYKMLSKLEVNPEKISKFSLAILDRFKSNGTCPNKLETEVISAFTTELIARKSNLHTVPVWNALGFPAIS
jgi:hypothetical protein